MGSFMSRNKGAYNVAGKQQEITPVNSSKPAKVTTQRSESREETLKKKRENDLAVTGTYTQPGHNVGQSTSQSTGQSASQSTGQSPSQSASQPASQSASQSTGQRDARHHQSSSVPKKPVHQDSSPYQNNVSSKNITTSGTTAGTTSVKASAAPEDVDVNKSIPAEKTHTPIYASPQRKQRKQVEDALYTNEDLTPDRETRVQTDQQSYVYENQESYQVQMPDGVHNEMAVDVPESERRVTPHQKDALYARLRRHQQKQDEPPSFVTMQMALQEVRDEHGVMEYDVELPVGYQADPYPAPPRTLMLVGPTGSGKTLMADTLLNHALGVQFDSDVRFTLGGLGRPASVEEAIMSGVQTVRCYHLPQLAGPHAVVPFPLTVVDTPGLLHTDGIDTDDRIVSLVQDYITGCTTPLFAFITVQGTTTRLSTSETYVFNQIKRAIECLDGAKFGVMCTFCDSGKPPAEEALDEVELGQDGGPYLFNNMALRANNNNRLARIFWGMGSESIGKIISEMKNCDLPVYHNETPPPEVAREDETDDTDGKEIPGQLTYANDEQETCSTQEASFTEQYGKDEADDVYEPVEHKSLQRTHPEVVGEDVGDVSSEYAPGEVDQPFHDDRIEAAVSMPTESVSTPTESYAERRDSVTSDEKSLDMIGGEVHEADEQTDITEQKTHSTDDQDTPDDVTSASSGSDGFALSAVLVSEFKDDF